MSIPGVLARSLVLVYRYGLSPILPGCCRFMPSCSHYADEAIARHGAWRGGRLALRRLARCHPLGGHGWDPVPEPDEPALRGPRDGLRTAPAALRK